MARRTVELSRCEAKNNTLWRAERMLSGLLVSALAGGAAGCAQQSQSPFPARVVPAEAFSKSVHEGTAEDFSIFRLDAPNPNAVAAPGRRMPGYAGLQNPVPSQTVNLVPQPAKPDLIGNDRESLLQEAQRRGDYPQPELAALGDPNARAALGEEGLRARAAMSRDMQDPYGQPPALPPGSHSPYLTGKMRANPSLWPDEGQNAFLFNDFRAFQSMDVITIMINESSEGKKKTKTDTENEYTLTAGIKEFFGLETKKVASNNESLDPAELISASTEAKYEGKGETNRSGQLKAQMSAVILEVLPNGLLRVEGTKIVSVDNEEEVMVISGLVRPRDINSNNQVESNRIANMRVDFYGRGVLADKQGPGWLARIFDRVWPF